MFWFYVIFRKVSLTETLKFRNQFSEIIKGTYGIVNHGHEELRLPLQSWIILHAISICVRSEAKQTL